MSHESKPLSKRVNAPLGALTVVCSVCIVLKVCVELVQAVIRQMRILLLLEVPILIGVLLSGKSSQTILVNVEAQRVHTRDGHVDPEIKLVSVEQ